MHELIFAAQLAASTMIPDAQRTTPHQPKSPMITDDGLIIPKKLYNPVVDNAERQNLHKELLFNQKMWVILHIPVSEWKNTVPNPIITWNSNSSNLQWKERAQPKIRIAESVRETQDQRG